VVPHDADVGRVAPVLRRALLALIATLALWSLIVAVTAGVDLRPYGIPFKSTDPDRAAYAALALMLAYGAIYRARTLQHAASLERRAQSILAAIGRLGPWVAAVLACITLALGVVYAVAVAGGSDSWGYISAADLWLAGDLVTEQPIATEVPWPDADWSFAPLGYRPAQTPGAIVPVYSAGLSVLMALAKRLVGECGPYLVVPILGALMVWLTYWLGAYLGSPLLGVVSSALMATSPTFMFMLMNPMSDVPVSAFFLAATVVALSRVRGRALWTGVLVSVAVLIRPNLVPVGAVFLGLLIARAEAGRRWRAAIWFGAGGLPLILTVGAINHYLYGAPWKAGYGGLDQFYAWRHLFTNLSQYSVSLFRTETPVVLLSLAPLFLLRRLETERRVAVIALAAFAASIWLSYLFYTPFDAWWYLRFVLPAFPAMLVMAAFGFSLLMERLGGAQKAAVLGMVLAVPIFALRINTIREEAILQLWQGGVVYTSAAEYVRAKLPANAVILTVQHSGSIRYYADRLTLRWDLLGPEWWPRALDDLTARGYRPYFLVSVFEETQLRSRFGFSDAPDGPGTVVALMNDPESIRIYDPLRRTEAQPATIPSVVPCPCGIGP
jgi:hypothetical protein